MPAVSIADLNNAKLDVDHIAAISNSQALTATDRLGNVKDTLAGVINKITAFNDRGPWVTARSYAVKDLVSNGGTWYVCVFAHTSGATFAGDVATKWRVYQGVLAGDLAADNGSSLIVHTSPGLGAVPRALESKLNETPSTGDRGANGNGVTDATAAIQAAIDAAPAFSTLISPPGTYIISGTLTGKSNLTIDLNGAKWLAKAGANFEYMLTATNATNFVLQNGTLDANHANRSAGQNIRFMGAGLLTCTDSHFKDLHVTGALGYNNIPGVGLTISGGVRCTAKDCTIYDCGGLSGTNAADAIYTSGTQTTIANCTAYRCTDTAFVLENTNHGLISGCTSIGCSAAAAVTNATSDDKYGNVIDGLTVKDWNASNTGGIQIGAPLATTGNIYDTIVSNVTMVADTTGLNGAGAAINIRRGGTGKTIRCTISSVRIKGTKNQGILVDGEEVTIANAAVSGTVDGCIQFVGGSDHMVTGSVLNGGMFGVVATNSASVSVMGSICKANGTGIAATGTSTVDVIMSLIKTPTVARYAKDAGATLNVVSADANQLMVNNATGGPTTGSIVNRFTVVDRSGSPIGYVPVYNV